MSSSITMPKKLQKFFNYCLSKIKNSRPQIHPSSPSASSSPMMRILSGCKQPKTPSFAATRGDDDDAATLSDVDRFLFENFKYLFLYDDESFSESNNNNVTDDGGSEENHGDTKSGSDPINPMSPDLLGDLRESSGSRESIVLLAWSENPCEDFRRSMQETVVERLRNHGRVDWGFMEELLLCYLNLNEKKSHKFILRAYVDLINGFRESSSERVPATAKPRSVRTFRAGKEIGRNKVAIPGIEKRD